MIRDSKELRAHLRRVFMDANDENPEITNLEAACHGFVFHMTDWIRDLEKLASLYDQPAETTREQAEDAITSLLYHASAHINEAARLYDYLPEPFKKD